MARKHVTPERRHADMQALASALTAALAPALAEALKAAVTDVLTQAAPTQAPALPAVVELGTPASEPASKRPRKARTMSAAAKLVKNPGKARAKCLRTHDGERALHWVTKAQAYTPTWDFAVYHWAKAPKSYERVWLVATPANGDAPIVLGRPTYPRCCKSFVGIVGA